VTAALPSHVQALLDPRSYPDRPATVDLIQTHISYVLLAGDFVYKLKKTVDLGFLDYTSLEQRRIACEDELRLNRRLSPDIYLEVLPVTKNPDGARFGGDDEPIDWAVQMRRLPSDRGLEELVAAKAVPPGAATRLGEIIGRFHLSAERSARIAQIGGRNAVSGNWIENFEQVRRFRGQTISAEDDDRIQAFVANFLAHERELLKERDDGGYIRDLHGDLRCAQIWVLESPPPAPESLSRQERELLLSMDGIRILDCIEFNERLRFCDVASDIGFLAVDLAYRRRSDLANELLSRYLEVTGDGRLPLLLQFYSCYRAYVRGKVDSLGLIEREIDGRQRRRLATRSRGFFRLAARCAGEPVPPQLVLMMGISGSGKSYVARRLAITIGAALISSDVTRKRLLGLAPTKSAEASGYSAEITAETYAELIREAEVELRRGHPVVLDATFLIRRHRAQAIELAQRLKVPFTLVWCDVAPETLEQRLRARATDPFLVSDAGVSVAEAQRAQLEPPREITSGSVIRLDTGGALDRRLRRISRRLGVRSSAPSLG
jgi:uncharacterized protein